MKRHTLFVTTAITCALVSLTAADVALAQDEATDATVAGSDEEQTDQEGSVIIVSGVRNSLRDAATQKRNAENIVEVITAEDIGALPGISIAESLTLLSGVSGLDDGGRIDEVGIRGLGSDFTLTTLNGREVAAIRGQRGVTLSLFPDELINQAFVYKTPLADVIEGGVGGTIEMRTLRPLDINGRRIQGSFRTEYNELGGFNGGDDFGYRGSIAYIDQFFDDKLGVAYAFSAREANRPIQTFDSSEPRDFRRRAWANRRTPATAEAAGEQHVQPGSTNGAASLPLGDDTPHFLQLREILGLPSDVEFVFPVNFFLRREALEDDLQSHMLVLQYQPNSNWDFTFDGLYSSGSADNFRSAFQVNLPIERNAPFFRPNRYTPGDPLNDLLPNALREGHISPVVLGPTGYTDFFHVRPPNESENSTGALGLLGYQPSQERVEEDNETIVLGGNIAYTGDDWFAELDLSYSKGSREFNSATQQLRSQAVYTDRLGLGRPQEVRFDRRESLFPDVQLGADYSNPEIYEVFAADRAFASSEDELYATRIEFGRDFTEAGLLKQIKAGYRYASRSRENEFRQTIIRANRGNSDYFFRGFDYTDFGNPTIVDLDVIDPDGNSSIDFGSLGITSAIIDQPFLQNYGSNNNGATLPQNWIGWDFDELDALLFPNGEYPDYAQTGTYIPNKWEVEEVTHAFFAKADFEGDLGSVPFRGGIGVRVVNTRSKVTNTVDIFRATVLDVAAAYGNQQPTDGNGQPLSLPDPRLSIEYISPTGTFQSGEPVDLSRLGTQVTKNNYTDVLPSLNLAFEPIPDLVFRLGAARVISRPTLSELGQGLVPRTRDIEDQNGDGLLNEQDIALVLSSGQTDDINALAGLDPASVQTNAVSGNPLLEPFRANQLDLSLEYYFNDDTSIALGLFYKDVDSFINSRSIQTFISDAAVGEQVPFTQAQIDQANAQNEVLGFNDISVVNGQGTTPVLLVADAPGNGEGGVIKGFEASARASLDYDTLPSFIRGFGGSFTYTYTDINLTQQATSFADPRNLSGPVGEVGPDYDPAQDASDTILIEPYGFSKHLFNSQVFWEQGKVSLRASYQWRSGFNREAGLYSVRQKARGQWDFSGRVAITRNLRLQLQVQNVFDEDVQRFYIDHIDSVGNDGSTLPADLQDLAGAGSYEETIPNVYQAFGRRIFFGVNFNF